MQNHACQFSLISHRCGFHGDFIHSSGSQPCSSTFTTVYIKWIKAKMRIINTYFNVVNSGLDSEKPLPKIDNLAYHSLFSIYWRKRGSRCFQISKSIWHKLSVHVRIFVSFWKNGEKMMLRDDNMWSTFQQYFYFGIPQT